MAISQRLDIRQTQTLVMTPQLQQAIKLLQMSNGELGEFVAEEVENNPLLESAEEPGGELGNNKPSETVGGSEETNSVDVAVSGEGVVPVDTVASSGSANEYEDSYSGMEDENWSADEYIREDAYANRKGNISGNDELAAANNIAVKPSLREHLLGQIHVDFSDYIDRLIATSLVELLDEAGYLPPNLDLIRAQLGATPDRFEAVIQKLQRMEPVGIFARSLPECLAAQLRDRNRLDPAMQELLNHLDLLAKREYSALIKLCAVDEEDLDQMIAEVRSLNPKPAQAFISDVAPPVTPDIVLRPQAGGGWHIELNTENLPRVLVNERYYMQIQGAAKTKEDKEYLSERWQQANWLVKALHQRATTILKIAAEIVRQQDKFFVHGVQHLKPLILRDIAGVVEMHESTVSRVTQNKYIATPRGIFELKYFFTNAIATVGGSEMVAAVAVRERIKALIDAESPNAILSDDKIVDLLRREGIELARRTVAKYREALRLPSSSQRRREKRQRK